MVNFDRFRSDSLSTQGCAEQTLGIRLSLNAAYARQRPLAAVLGLEQKSGGEELSDKEDVKNEVG